ncbi:MAG: NAD(P)/FAD-dependent oxidoreductase [Thermoplasmata archaeon]
MGATARESGAAGREVGSSMVTEGMPGSGEYDVVVVGAGPAGSTAARFSALGGAGTLLLERRREVGVPVRCGEFLPSPGELEELMPGVEGIPELFDVPGDCVSRRTARMVVVSPAGRRYELDFEGMSIDRARYDLHLASLAVRAGAELRKGVRVRGVRGGVVETNGGSIRARVVIGADGPLSTVRASAGMPAPSLLCPCLQYTIPGEFGDAVEMHFGSVAPGGYAWVIPKAGGANIGLGIPRAREAGALRERLDRFVSGLGIRAIPVARAAKLVPASGPVAETVRGDVILCGDAAGQVMASNGGGVPPAIVCGRAAGEAAAAFVRGRRPLEDYERRWRAELGEVLSNSLHVKRLANLCMWSDLATEAAMVVIGKRGIRKALTCKKLLGFY